MEPNPKSAARHCFQEDSSISRAGSGRRLISTCLARFSLTYQLALARFAEKASSIFEGLALAASRDSWRHGKSWKKLTERFLGQINHAKPYFLEYALYSLRQDTSMFKSTLRISTLNKNMHPIMSIENSSETFARAPNLENSIRSYSKGYAKRSG